MKVRIKFAKTGALVYIGHLDVMRYFQKLFRRCHMPIAYSEGFSPHQILSFSHPLPLGMESTGEYADIEITEPVRTVDALEMLRKQSVPEIEILSFRELPEKCENAMASVRAARYNVILNENPFENISDAISKLMARETIIVEKITKKAVKEEDIKPYIYEINVKHDDSIEMLISSGSFHNVKPELLIKALFEDNNYLFSESTLSIKRIDQYTEADNKLVSLNDVGTDIL